jgi:hypothetical protein
MRSRRREHDGRGAAGQPGEIVTEWPFGAPLPCRRRGRKAMRRDFIGVH